MKTQKDFTLSNKGEIGVLIKRDCGFNNYYPYGKIFEYMEVSAHFDHATLKIEKWRNKEQWTYRLMRNESDSLANWQGREQAINLMGENAIIEAEKQVKRNICNLRKLINEARLNPVYLALSEYTDKIKHYKTDFTYHDCLTLYNNKPDKFLWMVRNSGTWLIILNNDWGKILLEDESKKHKYGNPEHDIYYWNSGKLIQVTLDQALGIYDRLPKSE